VSTVGDGDYPGPDHERRVPGGPGVPQVGAVGPGTLSGAGLECSVQIVRDDGHKRNGFNRYQDVGGPGSESSDEHAWVITPDDMMDSFSSQKSENDGTDGLKYMFQV
jgi:hypothetical protein